MPKKAEKHFVSGSNNFTYNSYKTDISKALPSITQNDL